MEGKTEYDLERFLSASTTGLEVIMNRILLPVLGDGNEPQKEEEYLYLDNLSVVTSANTIDNISGTARRHPEKLQEIIEKLVKTGVRFESIEGPSNRYAYDWVDGKLSSDAVKETITKIGPIALSHLERSNEEYAKTLAEAVRQKYKLQEPSPKSEI